MILSRSALTWSTAKKSLAIGAGLFVLVLLAKYATGSPVHGATIVALALAPVALYLAITRPLLFPYGLYLLVVPFDPLFTFTGGPGATVTRYLAIAVEASLAVRMVLLRSAFMPPQSWYAWTVAIVVMIASTIWSIDTNATLTLLTIMAQLFVMYTLLAIYPVSRADLRLVARLIALVGTLAAVYGIYAYATGKQRLDATRLSIGTAHMHLDPNHYAAFFFIPCSLLAAWLVYERSILRRIVLSAALGIVLLNVLLTGSRGGLVSAGLILIYVGIRTRRYVTTLVLAIAAFALSFTMPSIWARFTDPSQSEGSGRFELWLVGLAALKHYWLLGSGFGTFTSAYDQYFLNAYQRTFQGWSRPAHDLLVQSSVELGIFGAAIVFYAWFASFRQNKAIPFGDPLFPMRIASEAAILGLFVEALTLDMLWYKYLWVALAFSVLVANAYRPHAFGEPRAALARGRRREPRDTAHGRDELFDARMLR